MQFTNFSQFWYSFLRLLLLLLLPHRSRYNSNHKWKERKNTHTQVSWNRIRQIHTKWSEYLIRPFLISVHCTPCKLFESKLVLTVDEKPLHTYYWMFSSSIVAFCAFRNCPLIIFLLFRFARIFIYFYIYRHQQENELLFVMKLFNERTIQRETEVE